MRSSNLIRRSSLPGERSHHEFRAEKFQKRFLVQQRFGLLVEEGFVGGMRVHPDEELLNYKQLDMLETVTRVYRQQKNHEAEAANAPAEEAPAAEATEAPAEA